MKKTVLFIIMISLAAIVAAAVLIHSSKVEVTVSESLEVTSADASFSAYPGDTLFKNITVNNLANGNVPLLVSWEEDSNPDNVTYLVSDAETFTNLPVNYAMSPGQNNLSIKFYIQGDSPIGIFNGTLIFERV